jgi:hypothetical protein
MSSPYDRRIHPEGFAGVCREITTNPQVEQQTNDVNILIRSDQTVTRETMGKANSAPGPDDFGGPLTK